MTVPRGITLVRLSLLAAVLFGELLAGPASAAEIVSVTGGGVRTDDGHGYKLHMKSVALALRGEIKEGDYDILFNSLKLRHDMGLPVAIIYLNSPGGDFREAMKIGRLIRKLKLTTAVGVGGAEPQICASACMFLMFSGSL